MKGTMAFYGAEPLRCRDTRVSNPSKNQVECNIGFDIVLKGIWIDEVRTKVPLSLKCTIEVMTLINHSCRIISPPYTMEAFA